LYNSKAFFFEKKKQKTFMSLGMRWGYVCDSDQKFFGSSFKKKQWGGARFGVPPHS
jgi:hypothetical protein